MARRPSLRLNAGLFDLGIAGFAAVAIGFAGFALPEWRLYQLLQFTGLPEILAAAQPPLGLKARLGAAGALAAFTFAAVYLLMRMLDRVPSRGDPEDYDSTIDAESLPIRLRRADAHPDNPARRPLIAGRELGEPFDELLLEQPLVDHAPVETPAPPAPAAPLPSFLDAEVDSPIVAKRRDEEVDFLDLPPPPLAVRRQQALPPIFERVERDPIADPILAAKPVRERSPLFDRAAPIADPAPAAEPVVEPAPTFEAPPASPPAPAAPPRIQFTPVAAPDPAPEPEPPVSPRIAEATAIRQPAPEPEGEESITDLMARLETGLRKREHGQPPTSAPSASAAAPRVDESIAERLRSAMTDLQKLTARG